MVAVLRSPTVGIILECNVGYAIPQDLLDELEASKQSRMRAWSVLQRLFRIGIFADHEFLFKIQLELDPGAGPFWLRTGNRLRAMSIEV